VNKRIKNGLARDWLMNNVKGLGLKEASHFLRNVGIFDYAIIDRHIVKFLRNKGYINSWKGYKREYLEVEKILNEVSSIIGIKVGILDLIIWYIQTKRILR
jgi:Thermostable 8-oxoguanine DNA glycosylase